MSTNISVGVSRDNTKDEESYRRAVDEINRLYSVYTKQYPHFLDTDEGERKLLVYIALHFGKLLEEKKIQEEEEGILSDRIEELVDTIDRSFVVESQK